MPIQGFQRVGEGELRAEGVKGLRKRCDLSDRGVRLRLGTQRSRPFEVGEACEIGIGGAERIAAFDGEGGEMGVGRQIAGGAE